VTVLHNITVVFLIVVDRIELPEPGDQKL